MEENKKMLFTRDKQERFVGSVRIGKKTRESILKQGMPFANAFFYAYTDVARSPLKGIGSVSGGSPKAKETCIQSIIVPFCMQTLFRAETVDEFDNSHKELCVKIHDFYAERGYEAFTVGKAQKWINMALKYACIYDVEDVDQLSLIFPYCHVPIDRYIANSIVNQLNVNLPEYSGFRMTSKRPFSAETRNFSWSRIDDYSEYITCQRAIRDALKAESSEQTPLEWEFDCWLKEKG